MGRFPILPEIGLVCLYSAHPADSPTNSPKILSRHPCPTLNVSCVYYPSDLKFESIALSVIVYCYGLSQNCRSDELFLCYSIPQNTPPVTRNVQQFVVGRYLRVK